MINNQRYCFHIVVLFQAILEDYPDKVAQSIECLTALAKNTPNPKTVLTAKSISQYFGSAMKYRSLYFYKQSIALLNHQLCEIVEELQSSLHLTQIDAKAEIISLFLKTIFEYQQYLPPQQYSSQSTNKWHIHLKNIYALFKINQDELAILKNLFLQNQSRMTYLPNASQIYDHVVTYYLILLKYRFSNLSLHKVAKYSFEETKAEFKARKLETIQRKESQMKVERNLMLSQLFEKKIGLQQKKIKVPSINEMIQTFQAFEQIEQSNQKARPKHPLIQNLINKYQAHGEVIMEKYRYYRFRRNKLMQQEKNDLSRLKDGAITRKLIRNPNCRYEDVVKLYKKYNVFIEREYYETNVHHLLEKENQYQQLRYLERVFKWVDQNKARADVFFIDCFSLSEENSFIVIVSFSGTLICRKLLGGVHFLQQVQQLLKALERSIIVLFIDQFIDSKKLEENRKLCVIRMRHVLFFLPQVSLAPNPCRVIANSIGHTLQKRLSEQYDLEKELQNVLSQFKKMKVNEVVQKEWEKAKQLAYPDEMNKDSKADSDKKDLQDSLNRLPNIKEENEAKVEEVEEEEYAKEEEDEEEEEKKVEAEEGRDRKPSDKFFLPRGHQQAESLSSPNPKAEANMENLQSCSTDNLRLALARLLQLNKSSLPKRL